MQANYLVPHCVAFLHFEARFWLYTFITARSIEMFHLALFVAPSLE